MTWRGVQFDGKHPRLVSVETFAQVQAVLEAHKQSGERSYRRLHYLAGSLHCPCGQKLIYSVSTGHRGESYDYWKAMEGVVPDDIAREKHTGHNAQNPQRLALGVLHSGIAL